MYPVRQPSDRRRTNPKTASRLLQLIKLHSEPISHLLIHSEYSKYVLRCLFLAMQIYPACFDFCLFSLFSFQYAITFGLLSKWEQE